MSPPRILRSTDIKTSRELRGHDRRESGNYTRIDRILPHHAAQDMFVYTQPG
ncbi:hypothetical protein [Mycolicibacterium mengxianglii]|uniref:hypothetical protein n=1 Tax=Mycolicibacterium mengxianglii TaxID=2736649 RepID=UPI0018EF168F|nr:hypothetical protein [Mycolicibacterium mengxianglii]